MDYWGAKIYNYCERGQDRAFWAEPLNAVSNAAFIMRGAHLRRSVLLSPKDQRGLAEAALIVLVYIRHHRQLPLPHLCDALSLHRAGSAALNRALLLACGYALRRYLRLHWIFVLLQPRNGFVASLQYAGIHRVAAGPPSSIWPRPARDASTERSATPFPPSSSGLVPPSRWLLVGGRLRRGDTSRPRSVVFLFLDERSCARLRALPARILPAAPRRAFPLAR